MNGNAATITPYLDLIRAMQSARDARAAVMAERFRSGETLQQIADSYGLSRERVRQLLKGIGVARTDGGAHKTAKQKRMIHAQRIDANCLRKYGLTLAVYRAIPASTRRRFSEQKRNAQARGIQWSLSLADWLKVWTDSGHWDERGRGKGFYAMSRYGDKGPYAIGNVEIARFESNNSEYINRYWNEVRSGKRKRPRNAAVRKSHCMRGHELTEQNTRVEKNGNRECRTCGRLRRNAAYHARKALAHPHTQRRQK